MILAPLPHTALRLHEPLPYSVYDAHGHLLLAKGTLLTSADQRQQLLDRGCFGDRTEVALHERAFTEKLGGMLRRNAILKELAEAKPDLAVSAAPVAAQRPTDPVSAWEDLEARAAQLLGESNPPDWMTRFKRFQTDFLELSHRDPDALLFVLMQSLRDPSHRYSITHAVQVALVCDLTARQWKGWSAEVQDALVAAAITMNVSMMGMQDRLASQARHPSAEQKATLNGHPVRSVEILRAHGVDQDLWLQAVALHHSTSAGPMEGRPLAEQLARVIQRADVFTARMSARANRRGLSATAAAQAIYMDERKQPDEAGAAIIKAVGLYPPGCFVRLKNGEVAVVIARGRLANEPVVASIVSRDGLPLGVPVVRDTRNDTFATAGGVASHEVKVLLNPLQMLKLR